MANKRKAPSSPRPRHRVPPAGWRPIGGSGGEKVEVPLFGANGRWMSRAVRVTSLNNPKLLPQDLHVRN